MTAAPAPGRSDEAKAGGIVDHLHETREAGEAG